MEGSSSSPLYEVLLRVGFLNAMRYFRKEQGGEAYFSRRQVAPTAFILLQVPLVALVPESAKEPAMPLAVRLGNLHAGLRSNGRRARAHIP